MIGSWSNLCIGLTLMQHWKWHKDKGTRSKVKVVYAIVWKNCFGYKSEPRRGRGGSSEISPPLLRSSGLSKNLFYQPLLTSFFLTTGYFAFSLLETLTLSFQSLHFSYVPYIGVKLLIWTTYSLLCRVMLCIMCMYRVSWATLQGILY